MPDSGKCPLGLVLACYMMPDGHGMLRRFMEWNHRQFAECGASVTAVVEPDFDLQAAEGLPPMLRILRYPFPMKTLSLPKAVNYGIRNCDADVIMKTDPDIYFSTGALLQAIESCKTPGTAFAQMVARTDIPPERLSDPAIWKTVPKSFHNYGGSFSMRKSDWEFLNGYDERLEGWGGDDIEIAVRSSKKLRARQCEFHPIYHINHPPRMDLAHFPHNNAKNITMIKQGGCDWKSDTWGIPQDAP